MKTLLRCALPTISVLTASCLASGFAASVQTATRGAPQALVGKVAHGKPHRHFRAVTLNNEGAWLLKEGKYEAAIARFQEALKLNPGYVYARDNLCIAYNNKGLAAAGKPREALACFHKALFVKQENQAVQSNLHCVLSQLGFDDSQADDCLAVAAQCQEAGDQEGAAVEYARAYRLEPTPDGLDRLDKCLSALHYAGGARRFLHQSGSGAGRPAFVVELAPAGETAYMDAVSRKIKEHWQSPSGVENKHAVVSFMVHKDGSINDVQIAESSGSPSFDTAAVAACSQARPLPELPAGAVDPTRIDFSFDFKVLHNSEHAALTAKEAGEHVAQARADTANGAYVEALASLRRACEADRPGAHRQLVQLAQTVSSRLPPDRAAEFLHAILSIDNDDAVRQLLNQSLSQQGIDPDSPAQRLALANTARLQGNMDTAIVEYQESLRLKDDPLVKTELAELLNVRKGTQLLGRWSQALKQRDTAENRTGLGYAYELCGDYQRAAEQYKLALVLDPGYRMAQDRLAALPER